MYGIRPNAVIMTPATEPSVLMKTPARLRRRLAPGLLPQQQGDQQRIQSRGGDQWQEQQDHAGGERAADQAPARQRMKSKRINAQAAMMAMPASAGMIANSRPSRRTAGVSAPPTSRPPTSSQRQRHQGDRRIPVQIYRLTRNRGS